MVCFESHSKFHMVTKSYSYKASFRGIKCDVLLVVNRHVTAMSICGNLELTGELVQRG